MAEQIRISQQDAYSVSVTLSITAPKFSIDISGANAISYNSLYVKDITQRVANDGGSIGSLTCLESLVDDLNPTPPSTVTGILNISNMDTASAVYSFIRERNTYFGACMTVYRSSDGETKDIYFLDNGNIDSQSIVNFSLSGDVLVQSWYDQGFEGNHFKQLDSTLMPFIVKSGSYLGYVENQTVNTGDGLISKFRYEALQIFTILSVVEVTGNAVVLGTDNSNQYHLIAQNGSTLDPHTTDFTAMTYSVDKVDLTSPNRTDIYNALLNDLSLVKTTGRMGVRRKLQLGYGSLPSFNNSRYKAVVALLTTPANISDVEDELITKYSL